MDRWWLQQARPVRSLSLSIYHRRMDAAANPQAACPNDCGVVHLQRNDRATPRPRTTDDSRTIGTPTEMAYPPLLSGIEQRCRLSTHRILRSYALTFVEVAAGTCVGQVINSSVAPPNVSGLT